MGIKARMKVAVDVAMTVLLMLLMAFELIGRVAHEWIGVGMLFLFIVHHVFNWKWSKGLFKGKYTPFRVLQTILAFLVFFCMLGSMVSALLISREVFSFLPFNGGLWFGRTLHMLCAYWGFVFLSLHLGIHWNVMLGMAGKLCKAPSRPRRIVLRVAGACIALYGIYALINRNISEYLFLQTQFVFFDFDEPMILFFLDYLAVMGLFVWIGHYLAKVIRPPRKTRAAG